MEEVASMSISEQFQFSKPSPQTFPLVKQFYKRAKYHPSVNREDEIYVLRDASGIVGAVRLVKQFNHLILRSMVIDPAIREQGIGSHFLTKIVGQLNGRECWCYPFEWLEAFYAKAGFSPICPEASPAEIKEAYGRYRNQGRKILIMNISSL